MISSNNSISRIICWYVFSQCMPPLSFFFGYLYLSSCPKTMPYGSMAYFLNVQLQIVHLASFCLRILCCLCIVCQYAKSRCLEMALVLLNRHHRISVSVYMLICIDDLHNTCSFNIICPPPRLPWSPFSRIRWSMPFSGLYLYLWKCLANKMIRQPLQGYAHNYPSCKSSQQNIIYIYTHHHLQ